MKKLLTKFASLFTKRNAEKAIDAAPKIAKALKRVKKAVRKKRKAPPPGDGGGGG